MKNETLTDCAAEQYYQYLIPSHVFSDSESSMRETNQCIVFCKMISPDVFRISKGMAVMNGVKKSFNDGICMIAPETKVVFVLENN